MIDTQTFSGVQRQREVTGQQYSVVTVRVPFLSSEPKEGRVGR